jgi:hypothetical protein
MSPPVDFSVGRSKRVAAAPRAPSPGESAPGSQWNFPLGERLKPDGVVATLHRRA